MDKEEFLKKMESASTLMNEDILNEHFDNVLAHAQSDEELGELRWLIIAMEEFAECSQAISKSIRFPDQDHVNLTEEVADTIISALMVAKVKGIPFEDIRKAMNVKLERASMRIEKNGLFR